MQFAAYAYDKDRHAFAAGSSLEMQNAVILCLIVLHVVKTLSTKFSVKKRYLNVKSCYLTTWRREFCDSRMTHFCTSIILLHVKSRVVLAIMVNPPWCCVKSCVV